MSRLSVRLLRGLREKLNTIGEIAAFIVPSADAHQSEYVSSHDARRAALSGFSGSAGTAVVTPDKALLWTDGRYFLQASQQLSEDWTLMKSGERDCPTIEAWLGQQLPRGSKVGFDPFLESVGNFRRLKLALDRHGVSLVPITPNPIDELWAEQPPCPATQMVEHPMRYSGKSSANKLAELRQTMASLGAEAVLVTALDDVAWLLNVRGQDVEFNPVSIAFVLVTVGPPAKTILFVDDSKVGPETRAHLDAAGVELLPYACVIDGVRALGRELEVRRGAGSATAHLLLLDPATCNQAIYAELSPVVVLEQPSIVAAAKAVKNSVEVEGMRSAHVRDGAALVSFCAWLEAALAADGPGDAATVDEAGAADKLELFRAAQPLFVSPSFDTIASSGPNAAVIHYKPKPGACRRVDPADVFLLDSGGQYLDGTTDVTRTLHFRSPTPFQRDAFTRVLQGHIALATVVFPENTAGSRIDALARAALWRVGLDYRHGTGHGVGAYLNVHEGPQGISFRPRPNEAGFMAGMTVSNEPGYYHDGEFGIRIESVLVARKAATRHCFGAPSYLEFENLTWAPLGLNMVEPSLLSDSERAWVDAYHAQCREKLMPLLAGEDATNEMARAWLLKETVPLAEYFHR